MLQVILPWALAQIGLPAVVWRVLDRFFSEAKWQSPVVAIVLLFFERQNRVFSAMQAMLACFSGQMLKRKN